VRGRHGVEQLLSDGAATVFELRVEDALGILAHRKTWRVFRELSVVQITEQILDEHRQANRILAAAFNFAFDGLQGRYPARAFTMQAGESDAAFLTRLWAQEGIAWHFRCSWEDGHPVHKLVLADAPAFYAADSLGPVRFQRADATEARDTVNTWEAWRTLAPGAVARGSFDYKTVRRSDVSELSALDQGEAGDALAHSLVDYAYDPPRASADAAHLAQLGRSRILAHEFAAKGWSGRAWCAASPTGAASCWPGMRGWIVIPRPSGSSSSPASSSPRPTASASTPPSRTAWPRAGARPRTRVAACPFTATASNACAATSPSSLLRPGPGAAAGLLNAIVVGESGREVDVDEQGRIAVRFLFARDEEHPATAPAAPRDSARVRVLQPWADAGFGAAFWPRVGSEILIGFIQGHPDKPIALGGLYDGLHEPVRFSGKGGLPANGALSGLRSREFHGDGYNQLRFDDSGGQVGSQLFSSHAATQLNQGWLGTPRDGGKAARRRLRAGHRRGRRPAGRPRPLVSAFGRLDPASRQLAREETLSLMEECVTLFRELGQYAADNAAAAADPAPQAACTPPSATGSRLQHRAGRRWRRHPWSPSPPRPGAPVEPRQHRQPRRRQPGCRRPQALPGQRRRAPDRQRRHRHLPVRPVRWRPLHRPPGPGGHPGPPRRRHHRGRAASQALRQRRPAPGPGRQGDPAGHRRRLLSQARQRPDRARLLRHHRPQGGPPRLERPGHPGRGAAPLRQRRRGAHPVFVRPTDGQPIADARYEITRADGRVEAGVTDAEGRAQSIASAQFESLDVRFTPRKPERTRPSHDLARHLLHHPIAPRPWAKPVPCRLPLPGVVIFVHGVNSDGEWYDAAEQGLCEGLNARLARQAAQLALQGDDTGRLIPCAYTPELDAGVHRS
jgi:uncharacterized protein involved in type VI secretion and phage assembly